MRLAAGPAGGGKPSANNNAIVLAAFGIFALVAVAVMFLAAKSDADTAIATARAPSDTVVVVLAARTLYPGVQITEDDLFLMELPTALLPMVVNPDTEVSEFASVMFNPEQVIGQFPREKILANEYIRQERLADPGSGIGLNALIPPGMRAISVDVTGAAALTGFLQPGSYVDILVTMKVGSPPEQITKTLLQAVFVLAVDARLTNESAEEATARGAKDKGITILVTAAQAEDIVTGLRAGALSLTLRNPQDVTSTPLDGMNMRELLNRFTGPKPLSVPLPPVPPPPTPVSAPAQNTSSAAPPPENGIRIQIIRGKTSSEEAVDK